MRLKTLKHWALEPVFVGDKRAVASVWVVWCCVLLGAVALWQIHQLQGVDARLNDAARIGRNSTICPVPEEQTTAFVKLHDSGAGVGAYTCQAGNVRPEWEKAVAHQCAQMASVLTAARATK